MKRGIIFSIDAMVAFLIICTMMYLVLLSVGTRGNAYVDAHREFLLQKNAFMLADSLIKNCADLNSSGLANYNFQSKRCESGILNADQNATGKINSDEFFVKKTEIIYGNDTNKILFEENKPGNNCESVERIAYYQNEKANLRVVVCNE